MYKLQRVLCFLLGILILLSMAGCGDITAATYNDDKSSSSSEITSMANPSEISRIGKELEIYCFSAGKADAFLLMTENSTVLIDCGEKGFGQEILDYLEQKGISAIDYMIITHFDQDHVGGAAKVINNIPIGSVLQSNCPKDSEEYEKYLKALSNALIEPITISENYSFELDGIKYVINPPESSDYKNDDSNNSSLITSVYNGNNSFLFMGDAQTERLEEFLESNSEQYDFLKIPHHGGEDELMNDLIRTTAPTYAVITSSDTEPEDESTLELLDLYRVETYLTREGAVTIISDGDSITTTQ